MKIEKFKTNSYQLFQSHHFIIKNSLISSVIYMEKTFQMFFILISTWRFYT